MSFYKELSSISDFLHSIRKLEDYLSFDMKFPNHWGLPKSLTQEESIVPFSSGDDQTKGISFIAKCDELSTNEILNKINKVIKINRDREHKEKLFKDVVDNLKKTFETTDLESLKNLYFDFKSQKPLEDHGTQNGSILELVDEGTSQGSKRPKPRKTTVNSTDKKD